MAPPTLAALAAVGTVVGFLSGLVGIGGGVLMVPFLYFFYEHPAFSGAAVAPALEATIAHATSLFIIVPTAVLGTVSYSRAGLVAWRAAVPLAVASTFAAAVGARLAVMLPTDFLKMAFGSFLLFTAHQLIGRKAGEKPGGRLRLDPIVTVPSGLAIGVLSALLGVGGGIVAIPLLLHVIQLDLKRVAATSLAIVTFAATAGTLTYIATGWKEAGTPAGSLGFVHAAAAVPMMVGSLISVRLGTRVNQRMNRTVLRWTFGLLFLLLGGRLVVISLARIL